MYKYIKAVHKKTKDITVALTVREMSIKLNALEISITKALNNRTTLINHTIRTISKSEYCILTGNKLPEEEKQEISIPLPLSVPSHRELEALQIRTEPVPLPVSLLVSLSVFLFLFPFVSIIHGSTAHLGACRSIQIL